MKMAAIRFTLVSIALSILALIFGHAYSERVADHQKYSYFYEALDALPQTQKIVRWSGAQPSGRPVKYSNFSDISTKLTEAWGAYSLAMEKNNADYLRDYFVGTALLRGVHALESEVSQGANMAMMGMEIEPILFHLDGSFFQFHSNNAFFARFRIDSGKLTAYRFTKDCILSNITIRQSGWKISHIERTCAENVPNQPLISSWSFPPLKGVNYYPKNSPWTFFWRNYNKNTILRDLRLIKELNSNVVRIFLPKGSFVDDETQNLAIANLENFLEQAEKHELLVIPTLFDFRGELTPWSWSSDRYYLDNVLPVLESANNIAFVDLKNELDLDESLQSEGLIEAWVRTVTALSRHIAPSLRYTIGWSNSENALRYSSWLDVISYHEYGKVGSAQDNLDRIKLKAGGKPVVISEVGVSSYELKFGIPSNPEIQAEGLLKRLQKTRGAHGVLVWTLYDFPILDEKAIGGSFWNKGIQKNFGLVGKNENWKPAASVFKEWKIE